MKKFLMLLSIASSFIGQSQVDILEKTFSRDRYEIQYPKNWRLDTSKSYGTEFLLLSSLENQIDSFRENINLVIQDLSKKNIDLKEYKDISEKQINDLGENSMIIESLIIKKGSTEYLRMNYLMSQAKLRFEVISLCYIVNNKAYLITFITEVRKSKEYKEVAEKILSSFKVTY